MIGKSILYPGILTLLLMLAVPAAAEQQAFSEDSIAVIENHYKNEPFLLVMWSIECPPCREELALFSQLKRMGENFNLVLISTDHFSQQDTLNAILVEFGLEGVDSWIFASDSIEKLRYHIDPEWFGEMPRSYFYDTSHHRIAVSGKLTHQTINAWLKDKNT
ncbi:MAG: hypothetical protein K9K86_12055 [Pseudomonadales bacterium]|nr:hypothetical protein [Pseudomonadales bacterium]